MESSAALVEADSGFERRLRTAVRAGAWLLLLPLGLLLLQWFLYLAVMGARPPWFLSLLGSGTSWSEVRTIWLGGMVAFKVLFWFQALLVLWGALWASMLRKSSAQRKRVTPSPAEGSQPVVPTSATTPA